MSKRKYRGTILRSCIAAGAIAFQSNGHWQIEGPALMGIWTTMGISIARISEKSEINKELIPKLVTAIVAGIGNFYAAKAIFRNVGRFIAIPLPFFIHFAEAQSMALMTYVLGNSLVNIFEKEKLSTDEDIPKVAADILKIIVTG